MSGRTGTRTLLTALTVYGLRFPAAWLLQRLFPAQGAATQYVILILQEGLIYLLPAVSGIAGFTYTVLLFVNITMPGFAPLGFLTYFTGT